MDIAASLACAQDFLMRHPDVAAIFSWISTYNGHGTIQALKAAGYKPGEVKHVATNSIPISPAE